MNIFGEYWNQSKLPYRITPLQNVSSHYFLLQLLNIVFTESTSATVPLIREWVFLVQMKNKKLLFPHFPPPSNLTTHLKFPSSKAKIININIIFVYLRPFETASTERERGVEGTFSFSKPFSEQKCSLAVVAGVMWSFGKHSSKQIEKTSTV